MLRRVWPSARLFLERATGLAELGERYRRAEEAPTLDEFVDRCLDELGIGWDANELDLARIPRTSGSIVIANHPFGAAEGIILLAMLRRVRPDVKVLANYLLGRLTTLRPLLLSVDPFGGPGAPVASLRGLREAVRFVKGGGMLAIFPAGEVAHYDPKAGAVVDPPWSTSLARLVRATKVPVLPVHFHGQNGVTFQLAGLLHPRLRTALLPRELLNKRGRRVEVRVGAQVSYRKLDAFEADAQMVAYLRERTAMLSERPARAEPTSAGWGVPRIGGHSAAEEHRPIVLPVDPELLVREVAALPREQVLVEDGERMVCWARAPQIPFMLREIGRLREVTFRAAGEGTGKSIDLDDFDATYLHLFVFDRRDRALVGAYRLGPTDELLGRGAKGLYTSTLFDMKAELFRRMGPALEMGRSFVCLKYQRSASGLFLLWRGVGEFVAQRPRYRVLFGPVSISGAYAQASRELMVDFIKLRDHMHPFTEFVKPRHPFVRRRRHTVDSGLPAVRFLEDIEDVSGLVADIEPDQKGVPVLLKQYLKLGGKMMGFNVDPQFSGVLDGLILVDLLSTSAKTLSRYLGAAQATAFLAHHRHATALASTG